MKEVYKDVDLRLRKDDSGNIRKPVNADSIDQSIKTILSTYPGERVMLPRFGSRLRDYLFEPLDAETADDIRIEVEEVLSEWENRISIDDVIINLDQDANSYEIRILYTLLLTNEESEFRGKVRAAE